MPIPSCFFSLGRDADRLFYLQLKNVEAVHRLPNLREEPSSIVANLEQPTLDVNVAVGLIDLTQAHKVSLEPRNEVDISQLVVLTTLVDEQDGVAPFDLDDGDVPELYHPANSRVDLGTQTWPWSYGWLSLCRGPIVGARLFRRSE